MLRSSTVLCGKCEKAVTKLYSGALCADCKIESLESEIDAISSELDAESREAEKYEEWYRGESKKASEYIEYKFAFRKLVEEISKGRG